MLVRMKKAFTGCLLSVVLFCSCKSRPSDEEVKHCLLKQYDCENAVQLSEFKIENSREVTGLTGDKEYEFIVSGEVEWTADCSSFLQVIHAGKKERFSDKHVFLVKMDRGWGCP